MRCYKMRHVLAALLCASLVSFALGGCTDRSAPTQENGSSQQEEPSTDPALSQPDGASMSKEDIAFIVESMLPQAEEITDIYIGSGLPYQEGAASISENGADYRPVDSLVYPTIHQLQMASEQVFTSSYLKNFYSAAFDTSDSHPARYVEKDGVFLVDISQSKERKEPKWDTSTLKIVSQDANTIVISMEREGADGNQSSDITLTCENGNWRFDSGV